MIYQKVIMICKMIIIQVPLNATRNQSYLKLILDFVLPILNRVWNYVFDNLPNSLIFDENGNGYDA